MCSSDLVNLQDYKDAKALEQSYQEQVKAEIEKVKKRREIG